MIRLVRHSPFDPKLEKISGWPSNRRSFSGGSLESVRLLKGQTLTFVVNIIINDGLFFHCFCWFFLQNVKPAFFLYPAIIDHS